MAYVGLSLSGVLWINTQTVINDQSAYNNGLLRIQDYIDAHTSNTTQGTTAPDQHDWTHILLPTLVGGDIAVSSSNSPANLGIWGKSVMTRIHNLEGNGIDWASGSAVTTMVAVSAAMANLVSGATAIAHATTASSLDTPQSYSTLIADYKPKVSGANGTMLVSTGGAYVDSLGAYIAADGVQRTVSLPAQPSAGNIQYCWITKPPTVPIPHATGGVVGAAPAVPAYPTGEEPVALVIWRGSAAGGIVAAVDIIDIRFGHSFGSSGSSGSGTGLATTDTVVSIGALADGSGEIDIYQLGSAFFPAGTIVNGKDLSLWRVNPLLISSTAGGTNDVPLSDMFKRTITPNAYGLVVPGATAGTLTFNLQSGDDPVVVEAFGKRQEAVFGHVPTSGAITVAGIYTLMADVSVAGLYFGLVLVSGAVLTASNRVPIEQFYFDGTTFWNTAPHGPFRPMQPVINGAHYAKIGGLVVLADTGLLAAGGPTLIPGVVTTTYRIPTTMNAIIRVNGTLIAPASPGTVRIYVAWSQGLGVALGIPGTPYAEQIAANASSRHPFSLSMQMLNLSPGPQNFGLGYFATLLNHQIIFPTIEVEFTR